MNQTSSSDPPDATGHATMEGRGAYNQYSLRPAAAGALAVPLLEQAARAIDLGPEDRPLQIVDYGSSQGRNSLRPIRAAITVLRKRCGEGRPIRVTHTDLPDNDFSTLFHTLNEDADSYLRNQPNVFADAIGRSFFVRACWLRRWFRWGGVRMPPIG